jgi:5'-nucleotidase / UDP-sugar diphosphatase
MKRTATLLALFAIVVSGFPSPARSVLDRALSAARPVVHAQQEDLGSPRAAAPLTILQINDVYSTVPVDGVGGLARVAALKKSVAAAGRTPFLMLAGDFLSSSVESTVFKGEQMIAALNAAGLDMATLGNHEFDFGVPILLQRMAEAKWQWVVSNVVDTATNRPVGGAAPYAVRTFGGLKVGFIGLCVAGDGIVPGKLEGVRFVNPLDAAATYLPALKKERVDVIVALTHLPFAEDRALAVRFPEIDLIVGGHEHYPIAATEERTLISKSGSEARFVARIDVQRTKPGPVERFYELIPITSAIEDEPGTAAVVAGYQARLGVELKSVVATTRVALEGTTARLRVTETNLGNVVADAIREESGAEIAFVNSGGIRGDRRFEAGPITRYDLVQIHPFSNVICTVEVPGRILLAALNHAVARLPIAAGQFPQVSGLTMRVDAGAPAGSRIRDVRVADQPLDVNRTYRLAIPDFVLLGGDGFDMFRDQRVLVGPESGPSMVAALEKYFASRREIAPAVEGRIVITQ